VADIHGRLTAAGLPFGEGDSATRLLEGAHGGAAHLWRQRIYEAGDHQLDLGHLHEDGHVIPYRARPLMFLPVTTNRLALRLLRLFIGLVMFGLGIRSMLTSGLGVPPWDVLHQGLAVRFGLTVGIWSIIVSVLVLVIWIPLGERFGVGTLANAVIIGVTIDLSAGLIPEPGNTLAAALLVASGIVVIGIASGLYIGADLGPGPRDGLMTGISRRGFSLRLTRGLIEVTVLLIGWMLGGTFGIGTVAFALLIGPLVQFFVHRWAAPFAP
jgi:uncharacterized membrane protein YczE